MALIHFGIVLSIAVSANPAGRPAKDDGHDPQYRSATAGASTTDSAGAMDGTVVRVTPSRLWLKHDGAIVLFRSTPSTELEDIEARTVGDLKAGQRVHVRFKVQGTDNLASHISSAPSLEGTGGSGLPPNPLDPGLRAPTQSPHSDDDAAPPSKAEPDVNGY